MRAEHDWVQQEGNEWDPEDFDVLESEPGI